MNAVESLRYFIPEILLLCGAFGALLGDVFTKNKKIVGLLSLTVLFVAFFVSEAPKDTHALFFGFFTLDNYAHFFRLIAITVVGIVILCSLTQEFISHNTEGEYYSLFLFMTFALILMGATTNFLMMFLAIEFVSILSYLLVGFLKRNNFSKEAAIKYLLYGSLASGIMLYGISLFYGMTGSLEFSALKNLSADSFGPLIVVSFIFVLVGLGFKISMAPFHMWAPDVYEAAPTPVTAFLTVAPKALGFAVLLRFLASVNPALTWEWNLLLSSLAILTMTLGNIIAVAQTDIKRFLAYSSIAQAGYILMGAVAFSGVGYSAVLIYLVAYAFTNLGAFVVVIAVSRNTGNNEIESYAGLSKRSPLLAASMTIFLLSLAGIPPLAGFIGKFMVFASVIEEGYITLVVAAAINSVVAAYYYFRIVRQMYLVETKETAKIGTPFSIKIALLLTLLGTVLIGLMPSTFLHNAGVVVIQFFVP